MAQEIKTVNDLPCSGDGSAGGAVVWLLETVTEDFDIPEAERSPIPEKKGSRAAGAAVLPRTADF